MTGRLLIAAVFCGWFLAVSPLFAQAPDRPHPGPPPTVSPVMPVGGAVAPGVPDTVDIRFSVPDSLPAPVAVHVVQDTLDFGGALRLVVDYPAGTPVAGLPHPASTGGWLEPLDPEQPGFLARLFGRDHDAAPEWGTDLPATDGERVVREYRVYRRDPLRVAWQDETSPVLHVRGRAAGADSTATIRDPRTLGWTPWRLIVAALAILFLALLVLWWWRRRQGPEALADWPVPPVPWRAAAIGLQELLADGTLDRGETRRFLDRLAALARDYVADRYRIAAREMTGEEISRACTARGFAPGHPAGFARLLDVADRGRYDPESPSPAFCREQAVQFFGRLARVRIAAEHLPVAADVRLAADKAWSHLERELGTGAGREVAAERSAP